MSTSLPEHHGRRDRHVLRKALAGCSALAAAIALASAGAVVAGHAATRPYPARPGLIHLASSGAAFAGATTRPHPARPGPIHLIGYLRTALNGDEFPGYNVQIMNGDYPLCLDAENDSGGNPSENGDKVQLWTCNSGAPQQRWNINMDLGGEGPIISADGGLCLDAVTDSNINPSEDGDKVQLWQCSGASQQRWYLVETADGNYLFYNQYAGLLLAGENNSTTDPATCGDPVQVKNYTGQSPQTWTLTGYYQCS